MKQTATALLALASIVTVFGWRDVRLKARRPAQPSDIAPVACGTPVEKTRTQGKPTFRMTQAETTHAIPPFHWSQIESTNYHDYIRNLRGIGCPEATIRDIILADVAALVGVVGQTEDAQVESIVSSLLGPSAMFRADATRQTNPKSQGAESVPPPETGAAPNLPQASPYPSASVTPPEAVRDTPSSIAREPAPRERVGLHASVEASSPEANARFPSGEDAAPGEIEEEFASETSELVPDETEDPGGLHLTPVLGVTVPADALREIARRHRLTERLVTTVWLLLGVSEKEAQSFAEELRRTAQKLVGVTVAAKIAEVR